jgi:hypothetical protein
MLQYLTELKLHKVMVRQRQARRRTGIQIDHEINPGQVPTVDIHEAVANVLVIALYRLARNMDQSFKKKQADPSLTGNEMNRS